jgi:hypothetical protein
VAGALLFCMISLAAKHTIAGWLGGAAPNTHLFLWPLTACRWDASYEAVSLTDVPHRRLTKPAKVFEQFFDGERKARGRCGWDPCGLKAWQMLCCAVLSWQAGTCASA